MRRLYTFSARLQQIIVSVFFLISIAQHSLSQPVLELTPVITGLSAPIQFVHSGDGTNRIFIVEKGGTIRVYDETYNILGTFLTVTGITTTGERGLLSLVFHPLYEDNGLFFVYYTNADGNLELSRYSVSENPNVADALSKAIVLTIPHPDATNHNGGEMHFGSDGFLYLSTGDGGGSGDPSGNAQNPSILLGKMLRLSVNTSAVPPYYTIPADNPFGNEVYDLGLRNPFRWSFDRQTQDIWMGDVGQDSWEEINFRPAASAPGINYGWRCYEGNVEFNTDDCEPAENYIFPAHTYATQEPAAAITGGVVYRGTDVNLQGYYVSADYYSGTFYLITPNGTGEWTVTTQSMSTTGVADFGEAENGELYAVSLSSGNVYSVTVSSVVPVVLVDFKAAFTGSSVELGWATATEQNVKEFEIEYSNDGGNFIKIGVVPAENRPDGATYHFIHGTPDGGRMFYRLKVVDFDGGQSYSDITSVVGNVAARRNFVHPSVINGRRISIFPDAQYSSVELLSMTGSLIIKREISGRTGKFELNIPSLPSGTYLVRLRNKAGSISQKIILRQ